MRRALTLALLVTLGATLACRQDMYDQPKVEVYESNPMFPHKGSLVPPQGTVARGQLRENELLYTGKLNGEDSQIYPFPVTSAVLERGQQRFNIYCSPCHARTGDGLGMIVQRGMRQPPSFHEERLLQAPPGYFFDVITNGFGAMYSYASRISVEDRWAIVAYVQTLQFSRRATVADLSEAERQQLEEGAE